MSVLLRGDRSQQIIILHAFIRGKCELFLNICAFYSEAVGGCAVPHRARGVKQPWGLPLFLLALTRLQRVFQIPKKRRKRRRFPASSAMTPLPAQPGPAEAGAAAGRPPRPASATPRTRVPPGPRPAPCSSSASQNQTWTSSSTVRGQPWHGR